MPRSLSCQTEISTTIYTGGKTDAKGRVEGVSVKIWEAVYVEDERGSRSIEAGEWFIACITKTKNGKEFGACQPHQHFKTDEERRAAIIKRLIKAGI